MNEPSETFVIEGGQRHSIPSEELLDETVEARIEDGELIVLPIGTLEAVFTPDELYELWVWACRRIDWEEEQEEDQADAAS